MLSIHPSTAKASHRCSERLFTCATDRPTLGRCCFIMNSDAGLRDLPPGDPKLTARILSHLKSRGLFDELRRDCLGDVDTKPAYLNLKQRVDGYITKFLSSQTWTPDMNKNHVRDVMRREINESGMLSAGMDHLVDQIINPKIYHVFTPEVENGVRQFFGLDRSEVPPPTIQPSEQRLSEATMAVSEAAPDIDENTQDDSSAPSPKVHPMPPSPCDIISDVSSEPQLIIVTESNDRPEEDSEEPLPVPSPELEATGTSSVTTSSTTSVTTVADTITTSASITSSSLVTVAVTTPVTSSVTTCTTAATTSAPEEMPSKDITVSPSVVDTSEKVSKSSDDKSKRLTEDNEKEKSGKKTDDHKDDSDKKEKKVEKDKERYDDSSRSDSKSKMQGSSSSHKHSESSSRSSKSHKSRSEADTSKDKKDSGHSSTDTIETKGDHSRDKGESPKPELSREKSDKEKRSSHSSLKWSRTKESDGKSGKKKSDDRHRLQSSQHHDEKKHRKDDDRSKDSHRSHSHESKREKQRSSSKDPSKPQKSSSKSTDRSTERPSESSKDTKKEKNQEKRHVEPRLDADGETKRRPESPRLALWEERETSAQGEEILTFSYVKDHSSGGCEVDLKLISATCTSESSLRKDSVCAFGSPELRLPESEEGVTPEDSPLKVDSRTEAAHAEESLPVSEDRKDSDLKSFKRRKNHASPRAGKRSPEKKRQKRNEDGNESEGVWSDVTVSSVHTSDLSSYDDRISLSSAEEEQEDEDSGAKEKVKISLKEIKKIASISSSNEDEDKLSKSETEPTEESHKALPSDALVPLDEKAPLSSPATPGCQDNEGKMGLRRQRKINPKYVSEEFSSIFTEGKKPAAGTIDFSELAKYGKERHYDERPRRVDTSHESRRQSVPRVLPPVELSNHGELEIVTPSEEGSSEPSPERGRKPLRRLSVTSPDGAESRHRTESTSSKRYESSDLYKPRPIISSGTRRGRSGVQPPTSPTSEEEPDEDEEADTRKKRPLKVCIGFKRGNKSPGSTAPPKKRRV